MKTDDGLTPNTVGGTGVSPVGAFVGALKRRLRDSAGETALPEHFDDAIRQVGHDEDLADRFTQAATAIGVSVHPATTADWLAVVAGLLEKHGARSVAIPQSDDGWFDAARLSQLRQRLAAGNTRSLSGCDDETLFSADAAITGVVAAIAESGTLVCESRPGVARGSSLIPPVHIAVVAESQLLPDLCDWLDVLSDRPELPAAVCLISGPSKTADIEGVLVTGVHGPGQVYVVLVDQRARPTGQRSPVEP